jgi:hypothetical protein
MEQITELAGKLGYGAWPKGAGVVIWPLFVESPAPKTFDTLLEGWNHLLGIEDFRARMDRFFQ